MKKKVLFAILSVVYLFLLLFFRPWQWIQSENVSFVLLVSWASFLIVLVLLLCCVLIAFGTQTHNAKKWFFVFNVAAIGLGGCLTYIAGTFNAGTSPTLLERMLNITVPGMFGVLLPGAMCYYLAQKNHKS